MEEKISTLLRQCKGINPRAKTRHSIIGNYDKLFNSTSVRFFLFQISRINIPGPDESGNERSFIFRLARVERKNRYLTEVELI